MKKIIMVVIVVIAVAVVYYGQNYEEINREVYWFLTGQK